MRIRIAVVMAMALAGCVDQGDEMAVQALAGPGGVTVTAPAAGELAVSWAPDPLAWKYYLYQSAGGGPLAYVASVLDRSAAPPAPTSYAAAGLAGGVEYCYAIESAYPDGTMSELGSVGCGTTTGGGTPSSAHTVRIPASSGIPQNSTDRYSSDAGGVLGIPLVQWTVPIAVPDGGRLVAVRGRVLDSTGTVLTFITTKSVDATETGIGGAGSASAGSGAWQTLSRSMAETGTPGTVYYATLFTSSGAGAGHFAWVEADIVDSP